MSVCVKYKGATQEVVFVFYFVTLLFFYSVVLTCFLLNMKFSIHLLTVFEPRSSGDLQSLSLVI